MRKHIWIFVMLVAMSFTVGIVLLSACESDKATRPCHKPVYCFKTTDEPGRRQCDQDKAVAETKAKQAEAEGKLHTRLYEDCWDF